MQDEHLLILQLQVPRSLFALANLACGQTMLPKVGFPFSKRQRLIAPPVPVIHQVLKLVKQEQEQEQELVEAGAAEEVLKQEQDQELVEAGIAEEVLLGKITSRYRKRLRPYNASG